MVSGAPSASRSRPQGEPEELRGLRWVSLAEQADSSRALHPEYQPQF